MGDPRSQPVTEDFRGDFAQLAAMMKESWAANKEPSLLYTQEILRSWIRCLGAPPVIARATYLGDAAVAFIAGFPRQVILNGRPVRIALNSLLTASLQFRRSGAGIMIWRDLVEQARMRGYDGTLGYCVEGDDMNRMMPGLARMSGVPTKQVYSIEYLARFLRPASGTPVAPATDADVTMFLDLTRRLPDTIPLRRIWTQTEAEWQCRHREGAVTVSLGAENRSGILTGYIAPVDQKGTSVAILDDILWGTLNAEECSTLVRRFLTAAASRGAQSVSCPVMGYCALDPFASAGFRKSRRVLHAWLSLWNGDEPSVLPSMYIDAW